MSNRAEESFRRTNGASPVGDFVSPIPFTPVRSVNSATGGSSLWSGNFGVGFSPSPGVVPFRPGKSGDLPCECAPCVVLTAATPAFPAPKGPIPLCVTAISGSSLEIAASSFSPKVKKFRRPIVSAPFVPLSEGVGILGAAPLAALVETASSVLEWLTVNGSDTPGEANFPAAPEFWPLAPMVSVRSCRDWRKECVSERVPVSASFALPVGSPACCTEPKLDKAGGDPWESAEVETLRALFLPIRSTFTSPFISVYLTQSFCGVERESSPLDLEITSPHSETIIPPARAGRIPAVNCNLPLRSMAPRPMWSCSKRSAGAGTDAGSATDETIADPCLPQFCLGALSNIGASPPSDFENVTRSKLPFLEPCALGGPAAPGPFTTTNLAQPGDGSSRSIGSARFPSATVVSCGSPRGISLSVVRDVIAELVSAPPLGTGTPASGPYAPSSDPSSGAEGPFPLSPPAF